MCILIISSFWAIHYHQMRYWYLGYISYHFLTTMPRKYNQDKIHQQVQIQIKIHPFSERVGKGTFWWLISTSEMQAAPQV